LWSHKDNSMSVKIFKHKEYAGRDKDVFIKSFDTTEEAREYMIEWGNTQVEAILPNIEEENLKLEVARAFTDQLFLKEERELKNIYVKNLSSVTFNELTLDEMTEYLTTLQEQYENIQITMKERTGTAKYYTIEVYQKVKEYYDSDELEPVDNPYIVITKNTVSE